MTKKQTKTTVNVARHQPLPAAVSEPLSETAKAKNLADLHNQPCKLSVGEQLITARKACKLSLDEIAHETLILKRHLEAFETNSPLSLAKPYVLGYLRNIAEILKIDAEQLLEQAVVQYGYIEEPQQTVAANNALEADKQNLNAPDAPLTDSSSNCSNAQTPKSRKVSLPLESLSGFFAGSSWAKAGVNKVAPRGLWRTGTMAVLPMLCLCVVAFTYHSIDGTFDALMNPPRSIGLNSPDQLGTLAHEALNSDDIVSEVLVDKVASESLAYAENASTGNNATVNTAVQQNSEPLVVASQTSTADLALLTLSSNTQYTFEPKAKKVRQPVPHAAPGAADMIGMHSLQDRLVIEVYEDSWVDVSDSQGTRLYRDLARAGRRIDISGELPFALHLGNAPGLALELNGEPVSITRYRSDNSARLTLASN